MSDDMDQVIPNLWLGSRPSLKRLHLNANNIHSILSIMSGKINIPESFVRLQIPLEDREDEDVLVHFLPSIAFIQRELDHGRRVLVHCQAGISRSSTIVAAYLMYTRGLDRDAALALIRKARPGIQPNSGFMAQLEVFYRGGCKLSKDDKETRMFYVNKAGKAMSGEGSLSAEAMDMFSDYPVPHPEAVQVSPGTPHRRIRCRMCRQELATREHMVDHGQLRRFEPIPTLPLDLQLPSVNDFVPNSVTPDMSDFQDPVVPPSIPSSADSNTSTLNIPHGEDGPSPSAVPSLPVEESDYPEHFSLSGRDASNFSQKESSLADHPQKASSRTQLAGLPTKPLILFNPNCSGYFLEPMKWMEPFLEQQQLSGKILCPNKRCGAKLGNYDWAGVCCGCKAWVTPGFCISRSKVDEVA